MNWWAKGLFEGKLLLYKNDQLIDSNLGIYPFMNEVHQQQPVAANQYPANLFIIFGIKTLNNFAN